MLKEKRIENPLCCKAASNSVFSALSARNKMEKEKILENLTALQKANAKAYALSDIAPLVQKYIEKLLRQYNDSVRAYERLKKSSASESALHDALNKQYILKYQIEEAQTVRNTLANQAIEALEALQATQKEFDAFGKHVLKDESKGEEMK